jgi:hypothetical protein
MIPFISLGVTACAICKCRFEFDVRLVKRTPRVCAECKRAGLAAREKARHAVIKERSASVDVKMLERLAVRSYQEVGDLVGLSAESVRKVEHRALEKLRKNFVALRGTVQTHLRPEARPHGFRATIHRGE